MLSLNGMSLSDFKTTTEAMKTADALVADNKKELGHDFPEIPHETPLLVRVYYVFNQGKKQSWKKRRSRNVHEREPYGHCGLARNKSRHKPSGLQKRLHAALQWRKLLEQI